MKTRPNSTTLDRDLPPPGAPADGEADRRPEVRALLARVAHHPAADHPGLRSFANGRLTGSRIEVLAINLVAQADQTRRLLTRALDRNDDVSVQRALIARLDEELGRDGVPRVTQLAQMFELIVSRTSDRAWTLVEAARNVLRSTHDANVRALELLDEDRPKANGALLAHQAVEQLTVPRLAAGFEVHRALFSPREFEAATTFLREPPAPDAALLAAVRSCGDSRDLEQVRTGFYEMLGLLDRTGSALGAAVSPFGEPPLLGLEGAR